MKRRPFGVDRLAGRSSLAGAAVLLAASAACVQTARSAPGSGAPVAPNRAEVTAEVLDATVVDSSTLSIAPPQPLCVVTLRLVTIASAPDRPNVLGARSGDTIRALSKDVGLTALKGKTISATLSVRGDERHARVWVVGTPTVLRGGQR
jgi:hypothetical protein